MKKASLIAILIISIFFMINSLIYQNKDGQFVKIGKMKTPRLAGHTLTLLPDGKVLILGGDIHTPPKKDKPGGVGPTNKAEIYDPEKNKFIWEGEMLKKRDHHTATLLPNGKVLIAGGEYRSKSAEIFDPNTHTFALTEEMNQVRSSHAATLLKNGEILITGGRDKNGNYLKSAEIYNPLIDKFTLINNEMNAAHVGHTANLLKDGRILIVGNQYIKTAEIYDPKSNEFNLAGDLNVSRTGHKSILLPTGKVLIVGGTRWIDTIFANYSKIDFASIEEFNPKTNSFKLLGNMRHERKLPEATLLKNGKVLITGGSVIPWQKKKRYKSAEIYDPKKNKFYSIGNMNKPRGGHETLLLKNGEVLIIGGVEPRLGSTSEIFKTN